jgi:hypothetical protein
MPQTALKTVPPVAQIGLAGADTDFAPSDDDLLNSGEPELMRGPLRRWLARSDVKDHRNSSELLMRIPHLVERATCWVSGFLEAVA